MTEETDCEKVLKMTWISKDNLLIWKADICVAEKLAGSILSLFHCLQLTDILDSLPACWIACGRLIPVQMPFLWSSNKNSRKGSLVHLF